MKLKASNFKLPIIVGPTGVGKSEVAYHLALRLKAEIISADAFQAFKGLEVGTAQPPKEWQKRVKHHLVGTLNPRTRWSAVDFAKKARRIISDMRAKGRELLVVGGSGFYIRALVEGTPEGSAPTPAIRQEVALKAREMGRAGVHTWLAVRDPSAAARIHPNDAVRTRRALEKTFGPAIGKPGRPLDGCKVLFLGLERSRSRLDEILRKRTEGIWNNGLVDETKRLLGSEVPLDHPLWKAIGYQEAAGFLRGEMREKDALERIFRRTRQYAKRQWTWFRHQHKVEWLDLDEYGTMDEVVDELQKRIKAI